MIEDLWSIRLHHAWIQHHKCLLKAMADNISRPRNWWCWMKLQGMALHKLVVFLFLLPALALAASSSSSPNHITKAPNCLEQCGNIPIPYPFGVGQGCYRDDDFELICNSSSSHGQQQLYWKEHQVTDLSLAGEISINLRVSYDCYDDYGVRYTLNYSWIFLKVYCSWDQTSTFM